MSIRNGHWLALTILVALLLAGGSAASDIDSGGAFVHYKNVADSIVVIEGRSYSVDDRTVFQDRQGKAISFVELPVPGSELQAKEAPSQYFAGYRAVNVGGVTMLRQLRELEIPQ